MVIKYSAPELIAIGEMVILKECISRAPSDQHHYHQHQQPAQQHFHQQDFEPYYHQVYVPPPQETFTAQRMANSISADNFLQDFAQFQLNLDQSIQLNRDINWQQHQKQLPINNKYRQDQHRQHHHQKLTNSVAEFFKKAQQNFQPVASGHVQADSSTTRVRRLSEVEAELLGQLKGHIHV